MKTIYDFDVKTIDGKSINMGEYKNKVLLIVNVASKCGFTSQYEGLEKLYEKYKSKDFVVLGFPCNQFMNQEPGTNEEIKEFCSLTYNVKFPMFSKIDVNGDKTEPLYKYLKEQASGVLGTEAIKWNFTKFLIDKNGKVIERYSPSTTPKSLEKDIEKLL
ncbi:glutathione peroxidase [Malaciobacter molluscorum]|uniref:glutathione peroxidase n=1 Tax=Malaciobacter molluscorum TaxID=1032072 RepID=UPI00100B8A5B|nr:glutathione peroxidase [Malaciobacter molluscorum]RXJ97507.1 glutathione peroxidase [Malaciobacter molluscorum]